MEGLWNCLRVKVGVQTVVRPTFAVNRNRGVSAVNESQGSSSPVFFPSIHSCGMCTGMYEWTKNFDLTIPDFHSQQTTPGFLFTANVCRAMAKPMGCFSSANHDPFNNAPFG